MEVKLTWKIKSVEAGMKRESLREHVYVYSIDGNTVGDYERLAAQISELPQGSLVLLGEVRGSPNPYPVTMLRLRRLCLERGIKLVEPIAVRLTWSVSSQTDKLVYFIDRQRIGDFSALQRYVSLMSKYSRIKPPYAEGGKYPELEQLCEKHGVILTYSYAR